MGCRAILVTAMLLATAAAAATEDLVTVTVSPEVAYEPAWITVRVYVEPDEDNRALEVVTESEHFYRRSHLQLEGERASRESDFKYRDLPAGEYDIRASLIGPDGKEQAVAHAKLKVQQ